ncbi:hypothetical protein AVEN_127687-1 [Araneus ventricosus]|uniref:CRAL-TRIO domain-containing protein n=1 Tax=Araneus ventricosus TaxID=182803 RepID=A0A4Y2VGQ9_ARAVE|nr:hypothetical protein AVEN_127687-1 [Araneus ventricosus]
MDSLNYYPSFGTSRALLRSAVREKIEGHTYIPPSYFTWIYAALKPLIPAETIKKVRIYGAGGWKETLLEDIDPDDLPAYLGGNRRDPDGNPLCETFVSIQLHS